MIANRLFISDTEAFNVAKRLDDSVKPFNMPVLVMDLLEGLASKLLECLEVWQKHDVMARFIFEVLAKHFDPAKLFEVNRYPLIRNLQGLHLDFLIAFQRDLAIVGHSKQHT